MSVFQRGLTVSLAFFLLTFLLTMCYRERREKLYQQWEQEQSSSFLYEICGDRKISSEEFIVYRTALECQKGTVDIVIKEYQKEQNLQGEIYRYLITWEEIKEELIRKNEYCFSENSMVELCVTVTMEKGSYRKRYCEMVKGKETER